MVCVACAMSVILSCGGNRSAGNSTDSPADSEGVNQSAGNNEASAVSVSGGNLKAITMIKEAVKIK